MELVSYSDKKTWFVFEVEIDGLTKISHTILITDKIFLMIFYWVMSKVAAAAKKVVKLPAVPSRTYSDISVRSDSRMQEMIQSAA